jgi:hypothetical protein
MANSRNFKWTSKTVTAQMKKRIPITKAMAEKEKTVVFTVVGNGNVIEVKNKAGEVVGTAADSRLPLRKKIFNLQANSEVALLNPINKAKLSAAITAERANSMDTADVLFNEFLNSAQISFSLLENHKLFNVIGDNMEISGKLELITTEKGSIITLQPNSIRVMEPETVSKTTFSMEDYLGISNEPATTDAPSASEVLADELSGITA